ncbi:M48 family metallopeptidase [Alteromonas sp. a30]|uniref:M48 family metallopeptidase n=1 Tax=Alteromonas sp. a30 TaxID=2730917 RepID=UPI002280748A|nr:SprT family zinc-dependent metalloprotease [Alteromonas sp. a30]MCY7297172.1 M48 family metallopeptidase [Alteromonas sp. a30]
MRKRSRSSGRIIQTIERQWFDIDLNIQFKDIRSMRMRIDAQDGTIRVSAPYQFSERDVFNFVQTNLAWLQQKLAELNPKPKLRYENGDIVHLWGEQHELCITEGKQKRALVNNHQQIELQLADNSEKEDKIKLLDNLYRQEMKKRIPTSLLRWQPVVGKQVNDWGIRKMKTRWGTCNITAKRVWLSLSLAEKPPICLDYVLVHELVHLHEKHHNQRFYDLMTQFMPDWRECEKRLISG